MERVCTRRRRASEAGLEIFKTRPHFLVSWTPSGSNKTASDTGNSRETITPTLGPSTQIVNQQPEHWVPVYASNQCLTPPRGRPTGGVIAYSPVRRQW